MKKKIALLGVAVLVAGMILALSISHLVNSHEYEVSASFTKNSGGEFVSQSINMANSTGILYVNNTSSSVFLVPTSSIGIVNSSSVNTYAIIPSQDGNVTASGFTYSLGQPGKLYSNLSGSYNIVVFSNSTPSITYDSATEVSSTLLYLYGPLTIGGEVMWIAGTVVTAVGFILPWKNKNA